MGYYANRALRAGYVVLAAVCIALGYIGYLVPLMPSTIFFIMALWAAKKSSPVLEDWLRTRPVVGSILCDWEQHGAIKANTKVLILVVLWVSLAASCFAVKKPYVYAILALTGVGTTWFVLTRPNGPREAA